MFFSWQWQKHKTSSGNIWCLVRTSPSWHPMALSLSIGQIKHLAKPKVKGQGNILHLMKRSAKSYGKGHRDTEKGKELGLIMRSTKGMSSTMLHSWRDIFHTLLNLFFITTLRDSDYISVLQVKKLKLRKKKGHAWSHTIIKHKSVYTNFFIQLWVQNIC